MFFNRKKKKRDVLDISGAQLEEILKKAVLLAIEDINARCYVFGPEVMFEYGDEIHYMGVEYDKKTAKARGGALYHPDLVSVYLDKAGYPDTGSLFEKADIHGVTLDQIPSGIIVSPEYRELLDKSEG